MHPCFLRRRRVPRLQDLAGQHESHGCPCFADSTIQRPLPLGGLFLGVRDLDSAIVVPCGLVCDDAAEKREKKQRSDAHEPGEADH